LKKTAKKLVLNCETLRNLENLGGVAGGATVLCTATLAYQTCQNCPTITPPCHTA
jgi:hypothetical protein